MLLPHGYEGQGPEHSSARIERFLTLCAENNMQVCNCTTPAQYFHLLRRQMYGGHDRRGMRKPLVIFTPKSLLRHPRAVSTLHDFTTGGFTEIAGDTDRAGRRSARVVFCSGKIYYDLLAAREERKAEHVALVRVEQLYPFAADQASDVLLRYPTTAEVVWAQEEPRNMGPWRFMRERMQPLLESTRPRDALRGASGKRQPGHRVGQAAPAGAGGNRERRAHPRSHLADSQSAGDHAPEEIIRSARSGYRTPAGSVQDGSMTSELAQNSDERAERIRELCRYMELHPDEPMRLRDLALRAGLSTFHLQRTFKSIVGVTPKDYLEARRVQLLKRNLRESRNVTDAVYDSGFGSSSRVYERADTRLGMTPQQYRDGGRDASISYVAAQTSIGVMMIGATDRGICFLQFGNDAGELAAALRREYPQAAVSPSKAPSHPQLQLWIESIRGYLAGERGRLDLPLDIRATAFQMRVWKYLQTIPYGSVESYGEVAAGIGQPSAARAVARACATNQVAIVIPCHRVVRGTGELGGYRWGIERKRTLIDTERSAAANSVR